MSPVKEIRSVRNVCAVIEAIAGHQPVGVSELARVDWHRQERRAPPRRDPAPRQVARLDRRRSLASQCRARSSRASPGHRSARREHASPARATPRRHRRDRDACRHRAGQARRARRIDSRHNLRITAPVGSDLPLLHSSASRAIAAHLPVDELAVPGAPTHASTMTRPSLRFAAEAGPPTTARSSTTHVSSAPPVLTPDGYPLAAVIVCAPASRVEPDPHQRDGPTRLEAVRPETTQ